LKTLELIIGKKLRWFGRVLRMDDDGQDSETGHILGNECNEAEDQEGRERTGTISYVKI